MSKQSVTKKAKEAAGIISEAEFFEKLVEKSGYLEPATVKRVYNGLLELIFSEMKAKGGVVVPGLADIYLSLAKPRLIKNHNMAVGIVKESHHQVRMVPVRAVKERFKAVEAFSVGRVFDPAAKAGIANPNSANVRQFPPSHG